MVEGLLDFVGGREAALQPAVPVPGASERLNTTFNAARTIRQARAQTRLTQKEFAAVLGITESELVLAEIGEADCLRTLQISKHAHAVLKHAQQRTMN